MDDQKIAQEVAENEFDRFVDAMDLEIEPDLMGEDEANAFEKQKRRIVRAIERGTLIIDEQGYAIYTPVHTTLDKPLRFSQFNGAALTATDGKKRDARASQLHAMMGQMTKVGPNTFTKMQGIDTKVCMALTMLLTD